MTRAREPELWDAPVISQARFIWQGCWLWFILQPCQEATCRTCISGVSSSNIGSESRKSSTSTFWAAACWIMSFFRDIIMCWSMTKPKQRGNDIFTVILNHEWNISCFSHVLGLFVKWTYLQAAITVPSVCWKAHCKVTMCKCVAEICLYLKSSLSFH